MDGPRALAPHVEVKDMKWSHAQLRRSALRLRELLAEVPGFVSTGFTETPSLEVLVTQLTKEVEARVPTSFEGLPVETVVTGSIEAF